MGFRQNSLLNPRNPSDIGALEKAMGSMKDADKKSTFAFWGLSCFRQHLFGGAQNHFHCAYRENAILNFLFVFFTFVCYDETSNKREGKLVAVRRSKEEIIADIDKKIAYHEACISKLKNQKENALKPPKQRVRKTSMRKALDAIKNAGFTPDEILALAEKAKKAKDKA